MPGSLEQLDLRLIQVAKTRQVRADGIDFQGLRYTSTTLAAYVGETLTLRFHPRDVAEIRVFHGGRFLCRAACTELAGATVLQSFGNTAVQFCTTVIGCAPAWRLCTFARNRVPSRETS